MEHEEEGRHRDGGFDQPQKQIGAQRQRPVEQPLVLRIAAGGCMTCGAGLSTPRPRAVSESVPMSIDRIWIGVSGSGILNNENARYGISSGTLCARM